MSTADNRTAEPALDSSRPQDAAVWAAVSHEIRTPLMGVMGMLEILGHTSLTEEQRRIIATAETSSVALMRIIDDVLDFARLESSSVSLSPVSTDLGALAEDCAVFLAGQAGAKGLIVTCETDHRLPLVMCDPVRVRQLLVNLGGNAVKFTDQGMVAVSVQMTAATSREVSLRLTVRDSGIGIPENLRSFLFQPFSRLAQGDAQGTVRSGAGLGLAICRRIVEIMGGAISLEAASKGGSVFHIDLILPVAAAAGDDSGALDGLVVLAVEGDAATAIALTYLEAAGAAVTRLAGLGEITLRLAAARGAPEPVLVLLGPDSEAEDIAAVDGALKAMTHAAPSLLWLRPRTAIPGQVADSIGAHPLRRAELLARARRVIDPSADTQAVVTRRAEPAGFAAVREDTAAAARAEGRVVLVAEDNPINQDVLCQQLSILGFDCDIAENGIAALKALDAGTYPAMLCDCHMPGMDGFELTKRVRAAEAAGTRPRMPIIAVTANALPGEAARCRAAGMDDYLPKPIEIRTLSAMLTRWIPGIAPSPAASGPETAAAAVVDIRNLEAIYGNDPARLQRVLSEWRTGVEEGLRVISGAIGSGRLEPALEAAHRIKGSAGIAGAYGLSADAAVLETALRAGDAVAARDAARKMEATARAAIQTLRQAS
ncbi:MAG: response regulator [Rhodospirillaceae bacterium]|nr:response regulator [Rhodospirillaceae bacterium]